MSTQGKTDLSSIQRISTEQCKLVRDYVNAHKTELAKGKQAVSSLLDYAWEQFCVACKASRSNGKMPKTVRTIPGALTIYLITYNAVRDHVSVINGNTGKATYETIAKNGGYWYRYFRDGNTSTPPLTINPSRQWGTGGKRTGKRTSPQDGPQDGEQSAPKDGAEVLKALTINVNAQVDPNIAAGLRKIAHLAYTLSRHDSMAVGESIQDCVSALEAIAKAREDANKEDAERARKARAARNGTRK